MVGLVVDPEAPSIATKGLGQELQKLLARRVSDDIEWQVCVLEYPIAAHGNDASQLIEAARERREAKGWDLAIGVTDVPLYHDGEPVVADVSSESRTAVLSVPALGWWRQRRQARTAIVRVVRSLLEDSTAGEAGDGIPVGGLLPGRTAPIHALKPRDASSEVLFVVSPLRGRLRLALGMVSVNRPWRLVWGLRGALAAALATSAIALMNASIWRLAATLESFRLAVAAVGSVVAMTAWLTISHGLWERENPSGTSDSHYPRALYNSVTVLTVLLGVVCMYVALFLVNLLASLIVIDAKALSSSTQHAVTLRDYFRLAWLATSAGTVGGALGSGLESDKAVRAAAYGKRERYRLAIYRDWKEEHRSEEKGRDGSSRPVP